jgi:hypothetical protein
MIPVKITVSDIPLDDMDEHTLINIHSQLEPSSKHKYPKRVVEKLVANNYIKFVEDGKLTLTEKGVALLIFGRIDTITVFEQNDSRLTFATTWVYDQL